MRSAETMQRARFSVPVTPHHWQGGGRGPRPGVAVYEVQFKSVGEEGVRGTHRHVCLTSIKVFILLFNFQLSINITIIVGWVAWSKSLLRSK